ncbi:hypothetical protein QR680_014959 [Steinernema hermaphroditum]|uniref:Uncharacterized protein n=1 Tax=Steinernema hermaphroditum TaxID=289476 RepID=A0AA39IAM4_9BILA|nr:hypothetical protein QR680_014959 [Steinernema hermaphroditum]
MASAEQWKKAYKEIHGKTPTKKDIRSVAPASVKRNIFGTENPPSTPEKGSKSDSSKPVSLSLKRPEGSSFMTGSLTRIKKRKLVVPEEELRRSPRKHMKLSDTKQTPFSELPKLTSPRKNVKFAEEPVVLRRSPRKAMKPVQPTETKPEAATSSVKMATPKKVTELRSPFKVFSPHRLQNATIASISPLKRFNARNANRSLFASPEKPNQTVTLTNVSFFIEQEDKENSEVEEEVAEDMFVDETQVIEEENPGLIEKEEERLSKRRPVGDGTAKPRAKKDNFVRLNMRKKTFVRGQMSASAKRKKLFRHKRNRLA